MIEIIASRGARHLGLPGAHTGRLACRPRTRLIALVLAALLLVGGTIAATLLYRHWQPGVIETAALSTGPTASAAGATAIPELPPPDLLLPLSPEEAQKLNIERPVEAVAATPATPFKLRADEISRLRAVDCLTQAIYYEAASEGVDGGRAVAQVVLNRVRHGGYPNSVCGVVYQGSQRTTGCQFTFTCDGSLARTPVRNLLARSRLIASEALAGRIFASVGTSTHYHADYVVPYWASSLDKIAVVGRHIFYRFRGSAGSRSAFRQGYAGSEPAVRLPAAEVISDNLGTLQNALAPSEVATEIKVEEDRIEALAPVKEVNPQETRSLKADLSRGQLILGEAIRRRTPGGRPKEGVESGCKTDSVQQIRAISSKITRVGAEKPGC